MVSHPGSGSQAATRSLRSPMMGVLRYFERHWSLSILTRLFLLFLMSCTLVIGSWLGLATSPAYAASRMHAQLALPVIQQDPQHSSTASGSHLPYALGPSGTPVPHRHSSSGRHTAVPPTFDSHVAAVGEQSYYTYMKWQVNDHLVVEVNVGSGNLVVHASDLHIQGTGVDLSIERFYNEMATDAQTSALSRHWNLSVGADVYLQFNSDGSITYFSPSATTFTFTPNGSGGFKDPAGLNATLTNQGGDTPYHLNFHKNQETYEFGSDGHLKVDQDKNGNKVTFNQSSGVVSSITDTQGRVTSYAYNSSGDLSTITDPTGRTVQYAYKADGDLISSTDALGQSTTYSYDGQGNLKKVTPPSPLGATTIVRDTLSRATSVTDGKGQTTSFTYDLLDRITKVKYDDGSTVSYTRGKAGNVTSQIDNTGTTTFSYDAANRLLSKQIPGGVSLTMTYDAMGNLTSFTDQGGTVTYSYNAVNLVTSLTDPAGARTTFGYDTNNRRTSVTYPNGVSISLSYDKAGHETDITAKNGSTTLSSYSADYGGKSTRQSMTDNVLGQKHSYSYDRMNRLSKDVVTQGSSQVGDFEYSYDKAGNRTSQLINGTQTTFSYNTANQLTSTSQGTTYRYDANGNETSISTGSVSLVYNAKDQTTSIKGVSMNYTGTDQNQRVQAGGTSYVNSPLGISSQNDSNGQVYYTRDSQGNLVSERTPAGTFYYLFDILGSIVGLSTGSGSLVNNERYQYDPYGTLLVAPVSPKLQANPWRFASGYFDSSTGFTKFGVRYYDSTVGRWTQQDPKAGSLFDARSSNRYVYAKCDPVNVTDPDGSTPLWACITVGLGAAGGSFIGLIKPVLGALQAAPEIVGVLAGLGVTVSASVVSWVIIGAFGLAIAAVVTALIAAKCI